MNNQIEIFKNEEFGQVRGILIDGEPYLIGKDIVERLGYDKAYSDVIKQHCDAEDYILFDKTHPQNGVEMDYKELGQRGGYLINESALYALIFGSKLPTAKKFKRWVTSEVLPSIRKNGMYAAEELLDNPDLLIAAVTKLKEEREIRQALEEEKKINAPKIIFADAVSASKTSILVGDLAKILKQNNVDFGQKRLFTWLRENGYLIKRKGSDWNMPTQRSMDQGLFEIKESTHLNGDGVNVTTKTTKVTGKGQQYFINKLLKEKSTSSK